MIWVYSMVRVKAIPSITNVVPNLAPLVLHGRLVKYNVSSTKLINARMANGKDNLTPLLRVTPNPLLDESNNGRTSSVPMLAGVSEAGRGSTKRVRTKSAREAPGMPYLSMQIANSIPESQCVQNL